MVKSGKMATKTSLKIPAPYQHAAKVDPTLALFVHFFSSKCIFIHSAKKWTLILLESYHICTFPTDSLHEREIPPLPGWSEVMTLKFTRDWTHSLNNNKFENKKKCKITPKHSQSMRKQYECRDVLINWIIVVVSLFVTFHSLVAQIASLCLKLSRVKLQSQELPHISRGN